MGVASAASVVALAGCIETDDDDDDDDDVEGELADTISEEGEVDIGIVMGVTGGLEDLGPPIRAGAEAAIEQVNEADVGWEVNTRFEDTETLPEPGVAGAQAVVDAGFPMIIGALASDVSLPIAEDVTLEEGIIQMSPASTAVDFSLMDEDIDQTLTWRTTPSDAFQGPVAAEIAAEDIGADSVSTIARDDAYGRGLANAFADAFADDFGGTVHEEIEIDPEQDTFTAQLQQALDPDPDLLYIVAFPEEGEVLFRDFYEEFPDHSDLPILVPDGLQDASLPDDSGQDVATFANVSGTGPGISDDVASGLETYQERVDDGIFVREGYDAGAVLTLAGVGADGSDDPEDIEDAIRAVTSGDGEEITADNLAEGIELLVDGEEIVYNGVSRAIEFDENGDVQTPVYEYFEWGEADGEPVLETIRVIAQE